MITSLLRGVITKSSTVSTWNNGVQQCNKLRKYNTTVQGFDKPTIFVINKCLPLTKTVSVSDLKIC